MPGLKIIAVIPCRWGAMRFPGKPLALIGEKPMMWHVHQRCIETDIFDEIVIATDDKRIFEAGKSLNLAMAMTSKNHFTGTDRVAEVSKKVDADIYVNVQGDEPFIEPEAIKAVASSLEESQDKLVMASNAYATMQEPAHIIDRNIVKVILDKSSNALAYSRHPIPYPKNKSTEFLRQHGLYAFKKEGLLAFTKYKPGLIEQAEEVEMFRLLENGYRIRMVPTNDSSIPVDTQRDLELVNEIFATK